LLRELEPRAVAEAYRDHHIQYLRSTHLNFADIAVVVVVVVVAAVAVVVVGEAASHRLVAVINAYN